MQKVKGFTLIELVVVIVVVGILAGIAMWAYGRVQINARTGTAVMFAEQVKRDALANAVMKQIKVTDPVVSDCTDKDGDGVVSSIDTALCDAPSPTPVAIPINGDPIDPDIPADLWFPPPGDPVLAGGPPYATNPYDPIPGACWTIATGVVSKGACVSTGTPYTGGNNGGGGPVDDPDGPPPSTGLVFSAPCSNYAPVFAVYLNTHGVEFWTVPTTLTSTVALPAGMNATVDTTDTPPVEIVFADPNDPAATHYSNGTTSATELDDLNGGPLYLASVPSWWPVYSNNLYVDGQHGAFTVNWAPDYSSYTIGGSQADFDKEQDIFNMTGPTHSASGVDWYATLANNAVSEVRGNSYRYIATSTSGSWIVNRDIASSNMPAWNMGPGYLNEILTFTDPGVYTAPADAFVASGWEQDNKRVAFNANESREFSTAEQPSWWPANPSLPGYPLSTGPASEAAWSAAHGGTPYSAEAALAAAIAENPDFVHVDNATGTTYYAYAVNEDVDYCLQNN